MKTKFKSAYFRLHYTDNLVQEKTLFMDLWGNSSMAACTKKEIEHLLSSFGSAMHFLRCILKEVKEKTE